MTIFNEGPVALSLLFAYLCTTGVGLDPLAKAVCEDC